MAERLKKKILETDKMVDLVAGPGTVSLHVSIYVMLKCTYHLLHICVML